MPFCYRAFGLNIDSALEFPELYPGSGSPDVQINIATPETVLYPCEHRNSYAEATPEHFFLKIDKISHYLVTGGSTITLLPLTTANPFDVRLYVLGTCFGVLLLQRNILPLHGCAVATPRGGIIICGDSGIGKSTLAAALGQKGYGIISDDVCAIVQKHNRCILYPSYPQIKLSPDSISHLNLNCDELTQDVETKKFYYPIHEKYHPRFIELHSIIVLKTSRSSTIEHKELHGVEKYTILAHNTYRSQYIRGLNKQEQHFNNCSIVCQQVAVHQLQRPSNISTLKQLTDFIISNFIL